MDGAEPAAGGTVSAGGRGIPPMSAPHFSQYLASASFGPPHRLQYMVHHRRSMLPVVELSVTWNAIVAAE